MEILNKMPEGVTAKIIKIKTSWLPIWKLGLVAFFNSKNEFLFQEEFYIKLVKVSEEGKYEKVQIQHKNFIEMVKKKILGDAYVEPLSKKEERLLRKQAKLAKKRAGLEQDWDEEGDLEEDILEDDYTEESENLTFA